MRIVYVIPSYQRNDVLQKNTLQMLKRFGVSYDDIYVFIANEPEEITAYSFLKKMGVHLEVGPIGLKNMRNHITKFFPIGTRIVCVDDDVKDLVYMTINEAVDNVKSCKRYPLKSYPHTHFQTWMETTFDFMQSAGIQMFGLYPVRNGYFMKSLPAITHDLRFCVGAFWGCINDSDISLTLDEKEDVERTLQSYVKYGKILRFNHVAPITRYYTTKGGMQSSGLCRIEQGRLSALKIVATYPSLCSITNYKKSGAYEVKFLTRSKSVSNQNPPTCCLHWLPSKDLLKETQSKQQIVC